MTFSPLVLKLAPWVVGGLAVLTAVKMYGDRRAAEGQMQAYVATANRQQAQLAVDSVAAAKARRTAADSIAALNRSLAAADRGQHAAAHTADSTAAALRTSLNQQQAMQLDTITAAHTAERQSWQAKEASYRSQLALLAADTTRYAAENTQLRAINASLRAATEAAAPGHGASFVQRVSPYVAAALGVAYGVDRLTHR